MTGRRDRDDRAVQRRHERAMDVSASSSQRRRWASSAVMRCIGPTGTAQPPDGDELRDAAPGGRLAPLPRPRRTTLSVSIVECPFAVHLTEVELTGNAPRKTTTGGATSTPDLQYAETRGRRAGPAPLDRSPSTRPMTEARNDGWSAPTRRSRPGLHDRQLRLVHVQPGPVRGRAAADVTVCRNDRVTVEQIGRPDRTTSSSRPDRARPTRRESAWM